MRPIVLKLEELFAHDRPRRDSERTLATLLKLLVNENIAYLERHPGTPLLYESGVWYEPDPEGIEEWQSIPDLYASGRGDCEDLAAARVAELRHGGIGADPEWSSHGRADGSRLYHVRVRYPDGSIEDPSAELGMIS